MTASNIRVSIVEDDEAARKIVAGWLKETEGFDCLSQHATGEDAVDALPKVRPDIVLVDINLPGISGVECVRRLKVVLPQTQFMMVTVYEDSENLLNALAVGAAGYLLKQTPFDELLTALRSLHAGGSPMTGSIARKLVQYFQAPGGAAEAEPNLSPRERQVLELLALGCLYKEIAHTLQLSLPTVSTHIRHIYEKLHVRSRGQAVARYTQLSGQRRGPSTKLN
jgi:DNA-binding NarL/FixJ family response regulator